MGNYTPASAFGWLDLDAAASDRAATLLRAFEEPGTLDPIGLGAVRDIFSNLLVPGTSTIQTRLRYFLFIPWICQTLERDQVTPARFAAELRRREAQLIGCLKHLGPNQGVQGITSGAALQRMPSEAYWNGLFSWQIRRRDLSISDYGRSLGRLSRSSLEVDDDGNPVVRRGGVWAPLPEAPDDFLSEEITFDLTREEADVLIDFIRCSHPRSLFAVSTGFAAEAARAEFPWSIPSARLPEALGETVHHAQCASELTLGAQHLYNLLLAERAAAELAWDTEILQDRIRGRMVEWGEVMAEHAEDLERWVDDIADFWALVDAHGSVVTQTQEFVSTMVRRSIDNPGGFVDDTIARGRIRDREIWLKGNRARLGPRSALENWNLAEFGGQLTYRWESAQSYLGDLAAGLEAA